MESDPTRPITPAGVGGRPGTSAEEMLHEAKKALWVMVGFLAVIWIVQVINWADHYHLTYEYGERARDVGSLSHIFTAPFLHFSWSHIEDNSGPLFIFGFLAAYRGVKRFLGLTLLVVVVSGLAGWLTAPTDSVGAGASGVVFGYLGYVIVKGFFDRHRIDIVVGLVIALSFASTYHDLEPQKGIGWETHIGGLVAGIVGGWIFRDRSLKRSVRAPKAPKAAAPASGDTKIAAAPTTVATTGSQSGLLKELDDMGLL
jgi:membrane associated rhomboid family serine protease